MRKAILWALLFLSVPATYWAWKSLSFDYEAEVARAVVFLPNGDPNELAFSAALSATYPDGSAVDDLKLFVTKLKGTCNEGPAEITAYCGGAPNERPAICATQINDTLRCEIPLTGTVCVASKLALAAHISALRTLSGLRTRGQTDTC
jgi:hypothetical protein